MKTPKEIKKGLEHCSRDEDGYCCKGCPYDLGGMSCKCIPMNQRDALAYIQQLERERDAAIADLAEKPICGNCKHFIPGYFCIGCRRGERWEWRGVEEAEG